MSGIGQKVASAAAGKVASKAARETWRTTTLDDPPDRVADPLPRVIAWAALTGALVSVAQALVARALERRSR
jgi:hypothetical protein